VSTSHESPPNKEEFLTGLARGLAVLQAFSADRPEMTISEVAAATELSPAVARRCLLTLVHLGYAAQYGRRFVLRPRVLEFGAAYLESMNLADVAQPYLQELRDRTGDSTSLTILDEADIIHISHVSTQRLMRYFVTSGTRVPAYLSSTGRVLLAQLDEQTLAAYLAPARLESRTTRTVTSPATLRAILDQVRRVGYAVVVDELEYGLSSIGVPVYNGQRAAVAGVSCILPTAYGTQEEIVATRLPELRQAAEQIGRQWRYFPTLSHSLSGV
jgi:IclR family transcriptional regulator, pca regulon regulatory protein